MNFKLGFSEILLLCGTYLYSHDHIISIVLITLAILGSLGDYAIKREEKANEDSREIKKSVHPSGDL